LANLEQSREQGNRQGFLYALDLNSKQILWRHRVNRELPYVSNWPSTYFHLNGKDLYYENHSLLVKLRLPN
jgi:hypothetical protein